METALDRSMDHEFLKSFEFNKKNAWFASNRMSAEICFFSWWRHSVLMLYTLQCVVQRPIIKLKPMPNSWHAMASNGRIHQWREEEKKRKKTHTRNDLPPFFSHSKSNTKCWGTYFIPQRIEWIEKTNPTNVYIYSQHGHEHEVTEHCAHSHRHIHTHTHTLARIVQSQTTWRFF